MKTTMKTTMMIALTGLGLATAAQADMIFTENFQENEANRLSSTGWVQINPTQAFGFSWSGAGSNMSGPGSALWYEPAGGGAGAYKPFTGTVDTFGIAGHYAGIGSDANGGSNTNFADSGSAFVSGKTYEFSFTHFKRPDSILSQSFTAEIYDVTTTFALASAPITGATANDIFATETVSYLADGSESGNVGIRFSYTGGLNTSVSGVDNISLNVVPEPSSALLLGFGMLALYLRRIRN